MGGEGSYSWDGRLHFLRPPRELQLGRRLFTEHDLFPRALHNSLRFLSTDLNKRLLYVIFKDVSVDYNAESELLLNLNTHFKLLKIGFDETIPYLFVFSGLKYVSDSNKFTA